MEGRNLEWLLAAASDAMLIADHGGHIVLANPALCRLFGYAPGELQGQPVETLVPARLRATHAGLRGGFSAQPRPRAMGAGAELSGVRRDGREFPLEVSLSPLSAEPPLVLAIVHDITARKQAEAALQESEARMRAVFDSVADAIITIDEYGAMERLNPAAQTLFGYAEAEAAGQNVSLLMPPAYRDHHDAYLAHYRATGERKVIGIGREVEGRRKDGAIFPIELTVTEMWLGSRRMFTGVVRDISQRKEAERENRQLLQELTSANAELTNFAEGKRRAEAELRKLAAHQESIREDERKRIAQEIHDELGGLLTGIKAYIGVAIERAGGHADPLLAEAAGLAQDAIATVRRVITDLRPSVLDQLGLWAALEWHTEQVAQRSGLRCACRIEPDAAEVELDAGRSTMLFRVVQEGLTNVVRHAQAASVLVDAWRDGGNLLIAVADDGVGITEERLRNGASWGIIGMQERVRHFGGELRITPGEAGGTLLRVQLPLETKP